MDYGNECIINSSIDGRRRENLATDTSLINVHPHWEGRKKVMSRPPDHGIRHSLRFGNPPVNRGYVRGLPVFQNVDICSDTPQKIEKWLRGAYA
jgi:hypothetical protein